MCSGDLLSETDENGVTTTYGYDSARQLVEVIRSAVTDGETVITPETITSYMRDAQGRVLQTRTDTGAMTTVESTGIRPAGPGDEPNGRSGPNDHVCLQRRRTDDDRDHAVRSHAHHPPPSRRAACWKSMARGRGI